jgi:hypothetical protein
MDDGSSCSKPPPREGHQQRSRVVRDAPPFKEKRHAEPLLRARPHAAAPGAFDPSRARDVDPSRALISD